jgi:pimeloyl-ACP methyl ester carboxylesterase
MRQDSSGRTSEWPGRSPRALAWADRRTTTIDGHPLCLWSAGRRSSAPPVVMLAGLGYPGMLSPWMRATAVWTEATLLDLPGWRRQSAVTCAPTVEGIADAAAVWLRRADLPPVVLIGHSTGAQAALRTALKVPEHLCGVVLAGPTIDPGARSALGLPTRFVRSVWREDPRELSVVAGSIAAGGVRPVLTLIRSALADRPEEQISDLRVPALIITGQRDRVASPPWCQRLAELAAARWQVLPGGHNSCFPHAQLANSFVQDALTQW